MKVKVVIRDERIAEVILDLEELPQPGDFMEVKDVGRVVVLGVITTLKHPAYQAAILVKVAEV